MPPQKEIENQKEEVLSAKRKTPKSPLKASQSGGFISSADPLQSSSDDIDSDDMRNHFRTPKNNVTNETRFGSRRSSTPEFGEHSPKFLTKVDSKCDLHSKNQKPKLAFSQRGDHDNEEVIIFMSGFADDLASEPFKKQTEKFSKGFRCVVACLPDFEATSLHPDHDPWGYDFDDCVELLEQLIDDQLKIPLGQKIILCGHDFGAVICHLYTRKNSNKVKKLISLDNGWCSDPRIPLRGYDSTLERIFFLPSVFVLAFTFLFDLIVKRSIFNFLGILQLMFAVVFNIFCGPSSLGHATSDRKSHMDPYMCYPYFYLARRWWKVVFWEGPDKLSPENNEDQIKILPDQPYLFIWGQQKRVAFHSQHLLQAVKNRKDGSLAICVKSAGHYVHVDEPNAVNDAIEMFLGRATLNSLDDK